MKILFIISVLSLAARSDEARFIQKAFGICSKDSYNLTLKTSAPFEGILWSQTRENCSAFGKRSQSRVTTLVVNGDCGDGFSSSSFRDYVYVRKEVSSSPRQSFDEIVEIICDGERGPGQIRLLGKEESVHSVVSRKRFHEDKSLKKENANEIPSKISPIFLQAWMDLLSTEPRYSFADSFKVGQNVSLIIRWKRDSRVPDLKVGSCSAFSEDEEELRLTDSSGLSIHKLFPKKFIISKSKSGEIVANATFPMFKFAKSDRLMIRCELICESLNPIAILETSAEEIGDQERLAEFKSLSHRPSNYLRSDDLSAQISEEKLQDIMTASVNDGESLVCMSRTRVFFAFAVLIIVICVALVLACMLWSRARAFTSKIKHTTSSPSSNNNGLLSRRFRRMPGPYVVSALPYR